MRLPLCASHGLAQSRLRSENKRTKNADRFGLRFAINAVKSAGAGALMSLMVHQTPLCWFIATGEDRQ